MMMKRKKKTQESGDDIFLELARMKDESGDETVASPAAGNLSYEAEGQLTVDVYQDGDDIVIESTVAGVDPDDMEINIMNDSVTIRGKRHREQEISDKNFFYQECFWGTFSRTVILPEEVDPEHAKATFKNGVLRIEMPKMRKGRAKKVEVKTDE